MQTQIRRYRDTMLFGNPGRVPLSPGHPRESTLAAWRRQGLAEDAHYLEAAFDELGIDRDAMLRFRGLDVSFRMMPEFEIKILDHRDGHYVIRDWMGAVTEISDRYDESYLRTAKDFVTRKWHKFPVETPEDWQEMKGRFDAGDPLRLGGDAKMKYEQMTAQGYVPSLSFNGVFWQLREWCGFENLCLLMATDPGFVHEMASFWTDFVSGVLDRVLPLMTPERVLISEDMAYKAHSMISPAMTREFILPAYREWVPRVRQSGCAVIELDSDGYIEELIPLWIESGINCCSPLEVAAHCDIVKMRRIHGKNMAYMQGIDKRIIAVGGKTLEEHVAGIVVPLFRDGGYIPGCDHGVPPDISWANYIDFTRMLARHSGWL